MFVFSFPKNVYTVFDFLEKVLMVIVISSTKSISINSNIKIPKWVGRKLLLAREVNEEAKESS